VSSDTILYENDWRSTLCIRKLRIEKGFDDSSFAAADLILSPSRDEGFSGIVKNSNHCSGEGICMPKDISNHLCEIVGLQLIPDDRAKRPKDFAKKPPEAAASGRKA
jgi:hypothetical protein